jgi:hypothetical protein
MTAVTTREQGYTGLSNEIVRHTTTSTLAQVTTAGYWNNQQVSSGQPAITQQDLVLITYSYGNSSLQDTDLFKVSIGANGVVTLSLAESTVILPVVSGHFANFSGTSGAIADDGYLPSNAAKTRVVMANGTSIANHIATYADTTGTIGEDSATAINGGNIQAGLSGTAGTLASFPATATNGKFVWAAVGNAGNFTATVSPKSTLGQGTVYTIPDPGAATANFVLDTGTNASITSTTGTFTNLLYGATPVAQVDPASCTITAAAGATNTCTITVQLKDGSGTNMTRTIPFKVYLATDATGLTLQSAASTGYSVTSGGVKDPTGSTTITQGLAAFSSATGGCVLSLLDTGKGTGNLILMLPNGFKASAAITSGSYG